MPHVAGAAHCATTGRLRTEATHNTDVAWLALYSTVCACADSQAGVGVGLRVGKLAFEIADRALQPREALSRFRRQLRAPHGTDDTGGYDIHKDNRNGCAEQDASPRGRRESADASAANRLAAAADGHAAPIPMSRRHSPSLSQSCLRGACCRAQRCLVGCPDMARRGKRRGACDADSVSEHRMARVTAVCGHSGRCCPRHAGTYLRQLLGTLQIIFPPHDGWGLQRRERRDTSHGQQWQWGRRASACSVGWFASRGSGVRCCPRSHAVQ